MSKLRNVVVTLCGSLGAAIVGYVLFVTASSAMACCRGNYSCNNGCTQTTPSNNQCNGVDLCGQSVSPTSCGTCGCDPNPLIESECTCPPKE